MMNDTRTASMLQRLPRILAVTANSYGLVFPPEARKPGACAGRQRQARRKGAHEGKPMAQG